MRRATLFLVAACFVLLAAPAGAQPALEPRITGNELVAKIQLPGGIEAELSIQFEQIVGLNPDSLALSAALVDPLDPALVARLPEGGLVGIPAGFPVLVRIEPTASSALSFSGVSKVSIYTHNLVLGAHSPLRLFKAPQGSGAFQDITGFLEMGSVRAGGGTGAYSDFIIVTDTRPADAVIASKFDAIQNALTANAGAIPSPVLQDLQGRLTNARGLYEAGALSAAINAVDAFAEELKRQSGAAIPDVYRANSTLVNVAGLLRASADTLKFSLQMKSNQPALP
ncbi:MAG: DUF6689 family protein [Thermoanaerobaculia bacterium]